MWRTAITIKHTIYIHCSPELVWAFTQDYTRRKEWDPAIRKFHILRASPNRLVAVEMAGNLKTKFQYKLEDRSRKTTLAMIDTQSSIIESGGGSWSYTPQGRGTLWTATNTLVLKPGLPARLLRPLVAWLLRRNTLKGMQRAKKILEKQA